MNRSKIQASRCLRIVGSCEPEGQLAQSNGRIPGASIPTVRERFGIWVSLGARQKR